ncbi:MAG: hypothetical protein V4541_06195 [Bacteroidota bacterium]
MNTIEEQLWNYIDGHCTAAEKLEIEAILAINPQYHKVYEELMAVHQELGKLDFEEPSMSFSRNVMEQVNLELKPVALKTKVDNRIIYSIGAFFVLSLLCIFGYALATSDLKFDFGAAKINIPFKVDQLVNHTSLMIFLFVDVVLALIYFDSFLRKRNFSAQKKGN